jgi:hypothetical protein
LKNSLIRKYQDIKKSIPIHKMPLFTRHHEEPVEETPVQDKEIDTPRRRSTLFGRSHRSVSPASTTNTRSTNHTTNSANPQRRGLLHRRDEDPSIIAARERVMNAESAEKDADRALVAARAAVKEAREHIKRLEREAAEG